MNKPIKTKTGLVERIYKATFYVGVFVVGPLYGLLQTLWRRSGTKAAVQRWNDRGGWQIGVPTVSLVLFAICLFGYGLWVCA